MVSHDVRLASTDSFQGLSILSPTPHRFAICAGRAHLSTCCVVRSPAVPAHADRVEQRRAGLAFQYGVLVLELVTGQSPGADGELVRWAQDPGSAASVHRMVDADLGGVYDARELRDLVAVARLCTRDRDDRDEGAGVVTIPQIVRYLQGKLERIGCQARFG